jgi:hypothetical protein
MKPQAALFLLLVPSLATAQDQPDPFTTARMRAGVVALTPAINLTNLGVDTNVFNEVDDPKSDFTFTVSPRSNFWIRTQRGLISLSGQVDLVYFSTYDTERSVNGFGSAQYEYRFSRVRPFASFSGLNTRERPGFEIDARARRFENTLRTGVDVRVASKSFLEVGFRRQQVDYAGDAVFGGQPLRQSLNRTLEAVDLTWRQRLTVLTTWMVRASSERERFDFTEARNSDSMRVMSGFELGRLALIRGSAFVGFRRLEPAEGGTLPEFSGVTADVNVSYVAPLQTQVSMETFRDVEYSFDLANPYYVRTGWTATLTQRIFGPWDFQVRGGRDGLAYEGQLLASGGQRRDRINRVGGGIGYRLGPDVRLSFDVQSFQR